MTNNTAFEPKSSYAVSSFIGYYILRKYPDYKPQEIKCRTNQWKLKKGITIFVLNSET